MEALVLQIVTVTITTVVIIFVLHRFDVAPTTVQGAVNVTTTQEEVLFYLQHV